MRIAAILTCFNRKQKTLACLESIFFNAPDIDVFLTNDGCTDGTPDEVRKRFPAVHIIEGTGDLFWARGMNAAWNEAIKYDYDYYLWLNDDIELYTFFLKELLECEQSGNFKCIISGLIENKEKTEILYGGTDNNKKLIQPASVPQEITNMNGNVVLIPQSVIDKIGTMDTVYWHDLGDVDYGLTAKENGIKVLSTRIPIAAGYRNDFCRIRKWGVSVKQRFRILHSPLGSIPSINFHFRKKHFGVINASIYIIYIYIINVLSDKIVGFFYGDRYKDK